MSSAFNTDLRLLKQQLRQEAQSRRALLRDRTGRSQEVTARLLALPAFVSARAIAFYVSVRNEVDTRPALLAALAQKELIAVPYCHEGRLQLVRIENQDELTAGTYRIPEPAVELRERFDRQVKPAELDLVIVPGVAFDRAGNRLGHGAGYYDKLLADVGPQTKLVALAFDCQIVGSVPTEPHDLPMHFVLTESTVYRTRN